MRKFTISAATLDAMRRNAVAAALSRRERDAAQVPLYLAAYDGYELPARAVPGFETFDAEDARTEAGGITIGYDEDDDFY